MIELSPSNVLSICAIVVTLLSLVFQYFAWILVMKKDISEISQRLAKEEVKMELFWNAVGSSITSLIKQPVHFRKDELMDKLKASMEGDKFAIKRSELVELSGILNEEMKELQVNKDPKGLAYALALAYVSQLFTGQPEPSKRVIFKKGEILL